MKNLIPLSFVMRNAGIAQKGVSWQQARGTVWHGQVTGLGYQGHAIGALDVKSSPLSLLSGSIGSKINWTSPAGRARGNISVSTSATKISDVAAELDISRLQGVHPNLQLPLSGDGPNGERFEITLKALSDGSTGLDIRVERLDPEANAALSAMGFTNTGNGYTLRQEAALAGEN